MSVTLPYHKTRKIVTDRLDTYGVGQKQWGDCELARQATPLLLFHGPIRSKRQTMIFL